jgi:chaperonin GroES
MKKSKSKGKKKISSKKTFTKSAPAKKSALGTPYGDRILVKPLSAEETGTVTSFGIIIPDTAKEKPEQGRVVAVGAGKKGDDGKTIPVQVKIGDRVMFSKYGYDEVKLNGSEYYLIAESSILMVF